MGPFLLILIAALIVAFAVLNAGLLVPEVTLWRLGERQWVLRELPLVVVAGAPLLAGWMLGRLAGLWGALAGRRQARQLRRRLEALESELQDLRRVPIDEALPRLVDQDD